MKTLEVLGACSGGVLAMTACADGQEVRARFVERVGNFDFVLPSNRLEFGFDARRVRLQVGVFDNQNGPAPVNGIAGWTDGAIDVSRFIATRTPGRLAPYNATPGRNGLPAEDPFLHLTDIDGLMGPQLQIWECNGSVPNPRPTPRIRGRNTYTSVYEITIDAPGHCTNPLWVQFQGEIVLASGWLTLSEDTPVCPSTSGSVVFYPIPGARISFSAAVFMDPGPPGPKPPPCPSDWNFDRVVDSRDFFEYLTDFFAGDGEFNCDGNNNTSADFFAYVDAFLRGC